VTTTDRELTALQGAIAGDVVLPGSPDYDTARKATIARFHRVHPRAVVRCATEQDVVETLAVARLLRERVAVRGGGHCFAGRSSSTGIVLDVSPMDTVALRDGLAVVGAGTRLGALYDALDVHGLTLPAGCGPTVGVAGLTLGGGFGELGRRYGLTCDRLAGARVVCADGQVLDCDPQREPDLFWALRGGGPGFGVVTTLLFHPVPAPLTTVFTVTWPASDAAAVVAAWTGWAPGAPDELTATLRLVAPAEAELPAEVTLVGTMLDGDPAPLLDEFVRRAGAEPARMTFTPGSFREAKRSLAGVGGNGVALPGIQCKRSEFFRRPLPPDAAAALARSVVADRVAGQVHEVSLTPWAGAYNRVPPDATAFAHRAEAYLLDNTITTGDDVQGARLRLDRSWAPIAPYGSGGVYPNFPDPDRALPATAYHGGNHERLRRIHAAADPDAVLSAPLEEPCPAP
jgi:FAD/FMN-containing dehydrogenase